jgi:uncharacterized protein
MPDVMRVRELAPILRRRYGHPVRKKCLRMGTTCPNRDGSLSTGGCLFCAEEDLNPLAPLPPAERSPAGPHIAYFQDHSTTYQTPAELDRQLKVARNSPQVVALHLGTRPDCLPPAILDVLEHHARTIELMVELGLQTANDQTLTFINRQHDVACFTQAVRALHQRGAKVCAHVILGLPTLLPDGQMSCEGAPEAIRTAHLLGELQVAAVKIHNCHVLRGAPLARLYAAGIYQPPDLEGYLARLVPFLEHLPAGMEIHRLVGEARPSILIAPAFTANKNHTLQRIRQELEALDTWQGRLFSPSPTAL